MRNATGAGIVSGVRTGRSDSLDAQDDEYDDEHIDGDSRPSGAARILP